VERELARIYGHDKVRRMQAAMAKSNYLNANPTVDKRHMTYGEFPLSFYQDVLYIMADLLLHDGGAGEANTHSSVIGSKRGGTLVDLGSGVGRLTLAAALLAPPNVWKESVGLEIVSEHHASALDAQEEALYSGLLPLPTQDPSAAAATTTTDAVSNAPITTTSFILGDCFDPALAGILHGTTAVFAYSTTWVYDDPTTLVMGELSKNLAQSLDDGTVVAMTDRRLPSPFVLCHSLTGKNPEKGGPEATSTVHIYRLMK
jgi:hypothetical protein